MTSSIEKLLKELDQLRSPDGYLYAGLPKFRRIFGRDSLISARQLLNFDPGVARNSLAKLSSIQGRYFVLESAEEPGKIPHEAIDEVTDDLRQHMKRVPWLQKYRINYFTVDATPLFIILAGEYLDKTGDAEFIRSISSHINSAIEWSTSTAVSNGTLVYFKAGIGNGLQSQSWRDGIGSILELAKDPVATIGVQGYLIEALHSIRKLKEIPGINANVDRLQPLENELRESLVDYFFIEEMDYFALAIDGDGVAVSKVTSDPGHLLMSGGLSREMNDKIVSRLMEPDMLTDYGIRTLSSLDRDFDDRAYQRGSIWPHDNWMIAIGLEKLGYRKEYEAVRDSLFRAYDKLGHLPEYYGVDRKGNILPDDKLRIKPCYPQAWSTCALLNFIHKGSNGDSLHLGENK